MNQLLETATSFVAALAFDRPFDATPLDDPDWFPAIREAAGIHGLGPYIGLRLDAGAIDLPEPFASWFREQVSRNYARLSIMRSELLLLLHALRQSGVEAIPVKGAAMLIDGVDELVWRTVGDIDLLVTGVSRDDLDLALAHAGRCLTQSSWKHRRYTTCAPGPPLVMHDGEHPDNPRDVEVHAAIVEMFRGIRWDLTPWVVHGTQFRSGVRVPGERAMALHLAVHCSLSLLEGTGRAIQLIDLVRALDLVGPDSLSAVPRLIGMNTHARFIYPAVAIAARETGSAACRCVARELESHVSPAMRDWVASASLHRLSWSGRHERRLMDRASLWARSPGDRLRMLSATALPSPAILASETQDVNGQPSTVRMYGRYYLRLGARLMDRWRPSPSGRR